MDPWRGRAGDSGLLGFEAVLRAYVLANGATAYVVMSAAAGAALAWVLVAHARTGRIPALAIVVLVLATLVRAYWQVRRGRARGDAQMAAIDDSGSAPP